MITYTKSRYLPLPTLLLAVFLIISTGCKKESPEARYTRLMEAGKTFASQGKLEEARISLLSAVDAKPDKPEGYFELAEVLLRLRQYPKAAEAYEGALNLNPNLREARLHLATIYLLAREYERSESNIRKLLEANAQDVEARVLMASLERARNRLSEARKILEEEYARDPKNLAVIATLGDLELADGKPDKAEAMFLRALELKPNNAPVRLALSDLYTKQQRLDEAQELIEGLVKDEPANPGLRFYFAEFLLSRGLADKAIGEYEQTVKVEPQKHIARDRLYDMFLTRGKVEEAKKVANDFVAANPQDPAVEYFRGRNAELEQKTTEALQLYLKAIERMRNFAPAFRRAGVLELLQGDRTAGLEHLNQAIVLDSSDVGARITLAQDAFTRKEYATALEHVNRVLAQFPRQLGANILRADILLLQGDLKTARAIYEILTKSFPDSPIGYFKLAIVEEQSKNLEKALEWYRKGLSFDRKVLVGGTRFAALLAKTKGFDATVTELNQLLEKSQNSKPEYRMLLGSVTLANSKGQKDQIAKARDYFNQALEGRPSLVTAYYALAQLDSMEGKLAEAAGRYEQLVKLQPTRPGPHMLLGLAYEQLGKKQEAMVQYREILKITPRFAVASNNLAWLIAETGGDLAEAVELAQAAKRELPQEAGVADTLGWVYYKQGAYQASLIAVQQAVDLNRSQSPERVNPEILFHLGAVKVKLQDLEGAKLALHEALPLAKGNPELEKKINDLLGAMK